ncbi:MAG: hypothetical protein AABY43_04480 [Candidatus Omnitrophota bacterium]
MNNIFLYDFILKTAQVQLKTQKEDGSMPAGNNGPWNDIDTPVRNTAHWALAFYKAYEISKEFRFLKAAISACDYLLSKDARPYNASFLCRLSEGEDKANGLIGQAWAIEPWLFIGKELGRKDYLSAAEDTLLKHKYDEKMHLWHNLDIDGNIGSINPTFNQQLWFATINLIAGKKNNNEELLHRSRDFFMNIRKNLFFMEPGLIIHEIPKYFSNSLSLNRLSGLKIYIKRVLKHRCSPARIKELSIGYLPFNLYAFALAYDNAPDERWWDNKRFKKIIQEIIIYIQKEQFLKEANKNKYTWTYNPLGFEIAYALYIFRNILSLKNNEESLKYWIEKQMDNYLNLESPQRDGTNIDKITFSARLYEATRLPNIELHLSNLTPNTKTEEMVTHK